MKPKKGDVLIEHTEFIDWYHIITDDPVAGYTAVTFIGIHSKTKLPPEVYQGALLLDTYAVSRRKYPHEWLISKLPEPVPGPVESADIPAAPLDEVGA